MKKAWKALASVAVALALVTAPLATAGAVALDEKYPPPPVVVIDCETAPTADCPVEEEAEEPLTGTLSETGEEARIIGLWAGIGVLTLGAVTAGAAALYRRSHA